MLNRVLVFLVFLFFLSVSKVILLKNCDAQTQRLHIHTNTHTQKAPKPYRFSSADFWTPNDINELFVPKIIESTHPICKYFSRGNF